MKGDEKEMKPTGSNEAKKPVVMKETTHHEQKVLVSSHVSVKQENSVTPRESESVELQGGEERTQARAVNNEESDSEQVANPENNVVKFQAQTEEAEHTESVENLCGYGATFMMATASGKLTIDLDADDLPAQFEVFKYRHSKMMTISNITDPAKQAASFINELPAEAVSIMMKYDWTAANKSENKIDDVIEVLCAAKTKKTSKIVARHRLLLRFMRKGEKFADFKKALFTLAEQCGYPKEQKETLLRDLIISRHSDDLLQRQLLHDLEDDVTLDKVIQLCERNEDTKDAAKEFHHKPGPSHQVNYNSTKDKKEKEKEKRDKEKERKQGSGEKGALLQCDRFCGGYHPRGSRYCKAFGTTCTKCGKPNHYEEVCRVAPLPGWIPRSKASELNHKRRLEQNAFAAEDHSDHEVQRDGSETGGGGYVTDEEHVKPDDSTSSSSDDEDGQKQKHPERTVTVGPSRMTIRARQDHDLRNRLERKEPRDARKDKRDERCQETVSTVMVSRKVSYSSVIHSRRREEAKKEGRQPKRSGGRHEHDGERAKKKPENTERHGASSKHGNAASPVVSRRAQRSKPKSSSLSPPVKRSKPDDELDFNIPDSDEDINTVSSRLKQPRTWDETVTIEGRVHRMKVDSGSTINTMSWKTFQRLRLSEDILSPPTTNIRTYSENSMQPMGEFVATIALRGRRTKGRFLVLSEDVPSLLGMPSGAALGLFKMHATSVLQFETVDWEFEGIDAVRDEFLEPCNKTVTLKMKENAEPVITPPRRVAVSLRDEVYAELQRMQKMGVITPVHEPRQ